MTTFLHLIPKDHTSQVREININLGRLQVAINAGTIEKKIAQNTLKSLQNDFDSLAGYLVISPSNSSVKELSKTIPDKISQIQRLINDIPQEASRSLNGCCTIL